MSSHGRVLVITALLCLVVGACRNEMHDQPRYEPQEPSEFFDDGNSSRHLVEGTVPRGSGRPEVSGGMGQGGLSGMGSPGAPGPGGATPAPAVGDRTAQEMTAAGTQQQSNLRPAQSEAGGGTTSAPGQPQPGQAGAAQAPGSPAAPGATAGGQGAMATLFPIPVDLALIKRGQERYNISCSPCHGYVGHGDGMVVRRGMQAPPSFHSDRLREAPVGHFYDVITNGFGAMTPYSDQVRPRDRWAIIAYIRALQLSQRAALEDVPPEERAKLQAGGPK